MFSANYRVLGAKIQYHRKIKGLTQQQLAGAIGISTNYLSAIERGVVQGYPVSIVWSVAKILGIKAEDLLKE